jgi:hypothetical protein
VPKCQVPNTVECQSAKCQIESSARVASAKQESSAKCQIESSARVPECGTWHSGANLAVGKMDLDATGHGTIKDR